MSVLCGSRRTPERTAVEPVRISGEHRIVERLRARCLFCELFVDHRHGGLLLLMLLQFDKAARHLHAQAVAAQLSPKTAELSLQNELSL
jgi:hypothetical protein